MFTERDVTSLNCFAFFLKVAMTGSKYQEFKITTINFLGFIHHPKFYFKERGNDSVTVLKGTSILSLSSSTRS
jgi:hypothetical protein